MMRAAKLFAPVLLCLVAFGCSAVVSGKLDEKPDAPDGGGDLCSTEFCPPGAADGTDCSTSTMTDYICVDHCCTMRRCGDGYVDMAAGEDCEPPGSTGCEDDCTFTCTEDMDCDDGDPCNGEYGCESSTHTCFRKPGMLPAVGTPCMAPFADGGVLVGQCSADNKCEPL